MPSEKKVSIIIPIYNAADYLEECLDSVLTQTLKEIEIICIDDGSEDDSVAILESYADRFNNFIILKQENQGAGPARNKGIEYAKGKYICFLDADDYYPDKDVLKKMYLAAEREGALICGGNFAIYRDDEVKRNCESEFLIEKKWSYDEFQECYYYWRFMYSIQLIRKNGIKFPAYRRFQDPPFFVRAMICAKWFYAITDIVVVYRVMHKEVYYDLEKVIDFLNGIYDVFQLAYKNQFYKLYEERLKDLFSIYKIPIWGFAYLYKEPVWEILQKINEINTLWFGKTVKPLMTEDEVDEYVKCSKEEVIKLKTGNMERPVIIYGAGRIGQRVKSCIERTLPNIIGYAVTEMGEINNIGKYPVKPITDYLTWKDDGLVVIAVGVKYIKEIKEQLLAMGFQNVYAGDLEKIRFAQMFFCDKFET